MKILFISLLLLNGFVLDAESSELKGKVRHANTYSEIANVNIYIEDTKIGTSSHIDGTFTLMIPDSLYDQVVVFEHVAFDTTRLSLKEASTTNTFYLWPRIITLPAIVVQAPYVQPEISKDIPQRMAVVEEKRFETQGYVDAGDLLNTQQSVQIDEAISGEKNISIRAGNPEDVIVLYNGIKLNDIYDNTYDLSQINLENINQIEIIKGSNTALYGSEAFSGVVNFVPKTFRNYFARFTQRFGTYHAGDWNLQLNHTFANKLNIFINLKRGNTKRKYMDVPSDTFHLQNKIVYHSANIAYNFSENLDKNQLTAGYLYSSSLFNDNRYQEELNKLNRLVSLQYDGDMGPLRDINLTAMHQTFDKEETLTSAGGFLNRSFYNRRLNLNFEKRIKFHTLDLLLAYQYEDAELKYKDQRAEVIGLADDIPLALYQSRRHGFVSIVKIHTPTGSDVLHTADFDISLRYDQVKNRPHDQIKYEPDDNRTVLQATDWNQPTVKFSAFLSGTQRFYKISTFLNFGTNIKFPTLFQQLSTPQVLDPTIPGVRAELKPEKNRSFEIGLDLTRELSFTSNVDGWQIIASYFNNIYENKFRMYYIPGIPSAFFENVSTADISGFEGQIRSFYFRKKLTLDVGASNYAVSDKSAFPFKVTTKFFANVFIDHKGYALQIYWFREGEQTGWIRDRDGKLSEIILPAAQNIDIHLGKTFEIYKIKLFTNFSFRNLLNDATNLEGIAIRDRRYYLSFGLEY